MKVFAFPPFGVAVIVALLSLCAIETLGIETGPPLSIEWKLDVFLLAVLLSTAAIIESLMVCIYSDVEAKANLDGAEQTGLAWYERGEPIEEPSQDRFNHAAIARRIAAQLRKGSRATVGIVGPYGSGKTGVINLVKSECAVSTPDRWFCDVNCWGLQSSAAIVERILESAVSRIGEEADCSHLMGLPQEYIRAVSAVHPWLASLEGLYGGSFEPGVLVRKLDGILLACGARLVVCIQDLDRNLAAGATSSLVPALLDRFKGCERLSFILAAGRVGNSQGLDFTRLCSHIEPLPNLKRSFVRTAIDKLRDECFSSYPDDIDTGSGDHRRYLESEAILGRHRPLSEIIAAIVVGPRLLKQTLSRTKSAWGSLHGEIDFDDLLVLCVLRAAAPECIDFLHQYRHEISVASKRDASRDTEPREVALEAALRSMFQDAANSGEWSQAEVAGLVDFLFPGAGRVLGREGSFNRNAVQGVNVGVSEGVDYWERAFSEEIAAGEVRDQEVIRALRDCAVSDDSLTTIANRMLESDGYSERWKYFADSMAESKVFELANSLFGMSLRRDGAEADGKSASLVAVFRVVQAKYPGRARSVAWLREPVLNALSVSIGFHNDIMDWWAGRQGVISQSAARELRESVVDKARGLLSANDGDVLVGALSAKHPYALLHLIFPPDSRDGWFKPTDLSEWEWLGELLVKKIDSYGGIIVPQIVNLIASPADISDPEVMRSASLGRRGWAIDRSVAQQVFGERLRDVLIAVRDTPVNATEHMDEFAVELIRDAAREMIDDINIS